MAHHTRSSSAPVHSRSILGRAIRLLNGNVVPGMAPRAFQTTESAYAARGRRRLEARHRYDELCQARLQAGIGWEEAKEKMERERGRAGWQGR